MEPWPGEGRDHMQVDESRLIFCKTPEKPVVSAHALVLPTVWDEFRMYPYHEYYEDMLKPAFPFAGRSLLNHSMLGLPVYHHRGVNVAENWGLVTYREVALLCGAEKVSTQQKQRMCSVIAHELAHQWFGNLVTMEWWDYLWLNEDVANWDADKTWMVPMLVGSSNGQAPLAFPSRGRRR